MFIIVFPPSFVSVVLAEMAVRQTRAYFKSKYGNIVDNPAIGKVCFRLQSYSARD